LFFLDILLKNHLTRAEYGVIINPYFQQKNEKTGFLLKKLKKSLFYPLNRRNKPKGSIENGKAL